MLKQTPNLNPIGLPARKRIQRYILIFFITVCFNGQFSYAETDDDEADPGKIEKSISSTESGKLKLTPSAPNEGEEIVGAKRLGSKKSFGSAPTEVTRVEREPCGLVDDYLGDVQALDPSNGSLTDVKIKSIIYCGTSVTVGKGWAQIRSQNGSRIHLGEQTMIQFPDRSQQLASLDPRPASLRNSAFKSELATQLPSTPKLVVESQSTETAKASDSSEEAQERVKTAPTVLLSPSTLQSLFKDDQVILFKGQIYVQTYEDDEEFRIVSATGRIRLKKAKIIATFSPVSEATQLITLENSATLENRFASGQRMRVHPGESTELNFKLLRVVPQIPTAISVASLRPKLVELEVPEKELWNAIHAALERQKKDVVEPLLRPAVARKPASITEKKSNYFRQSAKTMTADLRHQWIEQFAGDARIGEKVLESSRLKGKSRVAHLDPSDELTGSIIREKKSRDRQEKQRIIHALSQIHPE